jgi:hypothetical protein
MSEDWVEECSKCSTGAAFEKLKNGVEADVKLRVGQTVGQPYTFRCEPDGRSFVALKEGNNLHRVVKFTHAGASIVVTEDDTVMMEAIAVLGDDGVCRLRVKGQDLEFWQFRKHALEGLFFRP